MFRTYNYVFSEYSGHNSRDYRAAMAGDRNKHFGNNVAFIVSDTSFLNYHWVNLFTFFVTLQ